MSKNLIGIMSYLLNENYLKILEYIADKKEFTEREIKRQLKIKEEEIRKLLYILEENNIVYPISIINNNGKFDFKWGNKVPDKEKLFSLLINKEINRINEEIKNTPKTLYYCTECGSAYTFDDAYENDFICKECGSLLVEKENFRIIELENILHNLQLLLDKYSSATKKEKASKAKSKK
jgi:transcription initiation factor TFIIE subunit alpha